MSGQLFITPTDPSGPTYGWPMYGNAQLTGGVGGWEQLSRPRQRPATEWVDTPGHQLVVTLAPTYIDSPNKNMDWRVALLRSYGKSPTGGGRQPPRLVLSGPVELPAPWTLWVLNDLTPVEEPETIRNDDGSIQQAAFTCTFLEWTGASILLGPSSAARARAGKG